MKNVLRSRETWKNTQRIRGFTLVELAIVLAVAGLMFVGLWRLLAGGNQQVRDQTAASQQEQLISATKAYLASPQGLAFIETLAANTSGNLALPPNGTVCNTGVGSTTAQQFTCFLPSGFINTTPNSYGQTYLIQVLRDGTSLTTTPNSYSFMIATTGGDPIPDTSGGRISAFIGGDGGFIYSQPAATGVCGTPIAQMACGAYGAWDVNVTTGPLNGYGFVGLTSGHIASRTYTTPSASSSGPWLARQVLDAATEYTWNTMSTDLYMGGTSQVTGATASNIYLFPPAGSAAIGALVPGSINLAGPGAAIGGGTINMADGTINMQGGTISGTGTSNISLSTSAATAIGSNLVTLSGAAEPNTNLLNATNGCIFSYNSATGLFTGAQGGTGPVCTFSISTDNINVSQLVNANGLYAQTFIYTGSDIRLKKDIHPIIDPLDDIMKLNPVSYTYKSNGMPGMGVIAQELEKVYPQLVMQQVDGMKSVNYNGLIGPLIGAVQELKKENDDLRQQLKIQKAREDQLGRELGAKNNKAP